ncbi:MAG: DUF2752 domain-containing protein [Bacteroidota bacterium]|jgi:hypothetical protein
MDTPANKSAWMKILPVTVMLAGLFIIAIYPPEEHSFYGTCIFRSVTGLDCAGCGTLRGTHALLHGDIASAFRLNALYVISIPFLIYALFIQLRWAPERGALFSLYSQINRWWIIIGLIVAWTIARNILP